MNSDVNAEFSAVKRLEAQSSQYLLKQGVSVERGVIKALAKTIFAVLD